MVRSGADLALLLLGSFRRLVDAAVLELAARGYEDARPSHDFAMRAIEAGADSASELARRMSVTKQAAAKTITVLAERGYIVRENDPEDARRKRLRVTERGASYMKTGEAIFNELRNGLEAALGRDGLASLEHQLRTIVGDAPVRLESPGWVAQGP